MKLIIFTKDGTDVPSIPDDINNIKIQYVIFNSTNQDQLLLIAKYRIIDYPTSIIINERDEILMKVNGPIPDGYITSLLGL